MSEGYDWSQPPFTRKVYRWPFWKTFGVMAPFLFAVTALTFIALDGFDFESWRRNGLETSLINSLVMALTMSALHYFCWSIVLTPSSIGASSGLRTFRFEDIESVSSPWHCFGLTVVVKKKGGGLGLHVPTFLNDMDEFVRTLNQVTPEGSPLKTYFHENAIKRAL